MIRTRALFPYPAPLPALLLVAALFVCGTPAWAQLPQEPLEIGHEPQFVLDNYIVDNHWALRSKREFVQRVFHQAKKHGQNPLWSGDKPSYLWVVRDEEAGLFRMYYQRNLRNDTPADEKGGKFNTWIAYAESKDGLHWERPDLKLFPDLDARPNNVVVAWKDSPTVQTCAPCIFEPRPGDNRGYRWLMLYRAKGRGSGETAGIRVVGTKDGVHWDMAGDMRIAHLHSDHPNTVSYDARRDEYVMFCRPKHIYRAFGEEMLDTGASRRVARMASKSLWTDWLQTARPQTILIPDAGDNREHFNYFYGMPTRIYAGVYFGFLEPFRLNDYIYTEVVASRDGFHFERFADRPKLIEYGEEGSWDDTMIFASPGWVEVGDQWWIYYTGWDGPHGTSERDGAIGLATIRKEGFVSLRGPQGGGVVCTRVLKWPGGDLRVNAAATDGELRVRVSDADRRPIDGFNYDDCQTFAGDDVAHAVTWNGTSLDKLKGREIRLEFFLRDADLYTFRAAE
ncbi:MAG: hypothetical protein RIC55_00385 [Pirellulaceae bacterium]